MRNFTFLFIFLVGFAAGAIESANVLPHKVRNLSVKYGQYIGLDEAYTNSGELKYLNDINSIELDPDFLATFDTRIRDVLIPLLNQFGTYNIGDQVHLGKLDITANPEIDYYAPTFLYGFSKRFTAGIAIPVISYENSVGVTQVGSNLSQIQSELAGISAELDAAFNALDQDMALAFRQTLTSKGYKNLESKNETFIGDVLLVSAYQLDTQSTAFKHATQLHIGLPTGPEPDEDDLADLENFNRWSIKPIWISEYQLSKSTRIIGSTFYNLILPQNRTKRVPLDSEDTLPDGSQKMTLKEDIGDIWTVSGAVRYALTESASIATGYSREQKWEDTYRGAPSGRDRYLSKDSDRQADIIKLEFEYSTVQDYLNKRASLPASVVFEISKVINGKNIENQTQLEAGFNVYF